MLLSVSWLVASPYRQLGLAVVKGVRGYTNSPADPDNLIVPRLRNPRSLGSRTFRVLRLLLHARTHYLDRRGR